jgi:hypothetical protein
LVREFKGHQTGVQTVAIGSGQALIRAGRYAIYSRDYYGFAYKWDDQTGERSEVSKSEEEWLKVLATKNAPVSDRRPLQIALSGSTIRMLDNNGGLLATFSVLPDNHWVTIAADGRSYTGSAGAEAYLRLSDRDGLGTHALDRAFVTAHRRDRLELVKRENR